MAIGERLTKMREEDTAITTKLEAMRAGEGTADGVAPSQKVTDLMNQKQQLIGASKEPKFARVGLVASSCLVLCICFLSFAIFPFAFPSRFVITST
jgi:hypothetical protein